MISFVSAVIVNESTSILIREFEKLGDKLLFKARPPMLATSRWPLPWCMQSACRALCQQGFQLLTYADCLLTRADDMLQAERGEKRRGDLEEDTQRKNPRRNCSYNGDCHVPATHHASLHVCC